MNKCNSFKTPPEHAQEEIYEIENLYRPPKNHIVSLYIYTLKT